MLAGSLFEFEAIHIKGKHFVITAMKVDSTLFSSHAMMLNFILLLNSLFLQSY